MTNFGHKISAKTKTLILSFGSRQKLCTKFCLIENFAGGVTLGDDTRARPQAAGAGGPSGPGKQKLRNDRLKIVRR